jgi:hypothetical protein
VEVLAPLVRWWLFDRHRRPAKVAPTAYPDLSADAIGAYARGLVNSAPSIYQTAPRFSGKPSMALYAPQGMAVAELAKLVPDEWGAPQLIPAAIDGKRPGWQKGVDLGYAARDPRWQGDAKCTAAVRAAVEEFVGLCKGHTVAAWRVIEHYDIRLDAYRLRVDAWGPV